MSELDDLRARARELVTAVAGRPQANRAARLLDRLDTGHFLVAVVGEFNKGKSTLVNALIGEEVVPTGVLPLTAVATEIGFGEPQVLIEGQDGDRYAVDRDQLGDYVTEAGNPENTRGVARVELRGRWPLLEPGVVLVDTPGIGSVHRHNTEAGRETLLGADGAVVVLSVDAPMSERERELLGVLAGRRSPTFFVLNKADHLGADELRTVRCFLDKVLHDALGTVPPVYAVDARAALVARLSGQQRVGPKGLEYDGFAGDLTRFIGDDLLGALVTSARNELTRLGAALRDAVTLERAARGMDAERLVGLVGRFSGEAARLRQAFDDDRTLLARDVAGLLGETGERLAAFAHKAPAAHTGSLEDVAANAARGRLADELRTSVQSAVRSSFEGFRQAETQRVETRWESIAETFRVRTQARVDELRDAAAELFEVPLPRLVIPALAEQQQRFSYLFVHVGSANEPIGRVLSRLVPGRLARPMALRRAQEQLMAEFDKHAGRARWDVSQRLEEVRLDAEQAMSAELDRSIEAVVQAAARAQEWRQAAENERSREERDAERLYSIGESLAALGADAS